MTISVKDERLLNGSKQARRRLQGLEYGGETRTVIQIADSVLEESTAEFERAIKRAKQGENIEQLLSNQELLANPKSPLGETAARLYYLLQWRYAERRAKGEPVTERDEKIEDFLTNLSPTGFLNESFPNAVDSLEHAAELARQFIPEEVKALSDRAQEQVAETRSQLEQLSQKALETFTNLQNARQRARNQYLAARELTGGALRLENDADRLNDIIPPISQIMSP